MNDLKEIQRLRGMACLLVFCQHVCCVIPLWYIIGTLPKLFHYASCGVHLFFIISGFVIALSTKKKLEACCISDDFSERLDMAKNELKAFFTKRFFRLVPCFIASVIVMAIFHFFFTEDMTQCTHSWRMIVDVLTTAHADNVSRLAGLEKIHYNGAGLYWTLSIEVLFYIIWPVFFLALKNHGSRVKASLITGIVLWACARWIMINIIKQPEWVYYSAFTNLDGLFLGSFIGLTYKTDPNQEQSKSIVWCAASVILVLLMWMHPNMYNPYSEIWQNSAVLVSVLLVWLGAYNKGVLNIPVFKNFLEYLGNRSYSLYIYQMFLLYMVTWLTKSKYMNLTGDVHFYTMIIAIVVLFLVTELSYRFIETPFRKLGNKIADSFK